MVYSNFYRSSSIYFHEQLYVRVFQHLRMFEHVPSRATVRLLLISTEVILGVMR